MLVFGQVQKGLVRYSLKLDPNFNQKTHLGGNCPEHLHNKTSHPQQSHQKYILGENFSSKNWISYDFPPKKKHHPSDNSELVGFMSGFFSPVGSAGQLDFATEAEVLRWRSLGGKFHIGIWKSFFAKTLELKLCKLCITRFELVFFDLSFVWSLVSTTTSSILKRHRYESHATLQTLQRFFSTGKLGRFKFIF